jgi:hypothetical protein
MTSNWFVIINGFVGSPISSFLIDNILSWIVKNAGDIPGSDFF